MEISIKTLTGTVFELRVSPFETIASIKARIQRNEGIPISQQHIIWNAIELDDDLCLHDFDIKNGATLTLVLAMRDGPINMRRVSVEEPSLQEVAEYMDANRDEMWEKLMNEEQQITLLVYRDGDQLNFFRVYDRGDGVLSPYSDSISAGSTTYNASEDFSGQSLFDKEKEVENEVTKNKMAALKEKFSKKNAEVIKYAPRPPSAPKPKSKSLSRRPFIMSNQASKVDHTQVTESHVQENESTRKDSYVLPPVRTKSHKPPEVKDQFSTQSGSRRTSILSNIAECSTFAQKNRDDVTSACRKNGYGRTHPPQNASRPTPLEKPRDNSGSSRRSVLKPLGALDKSSASGLLSGLKSPPTEPIQKERNILPEIKKNKPDIPSSIETYDKSDIDELENIFGRMRPGSNNSMTSQTSDSRKKDKLYYRRTAKSYRKTPDGRLSSRLVASKINPHGNLPQISSNSRTIDNKRPLSSLKSKKRTRCFICAKKLGIATTYQCRCGSRFCAVHRYPETHACTYDYKTEGRRLLEKNNPVVNAPKLPKI